MTHSGPRLAIIGALFLGASALVACTAEEAISKADFEAVNQQVAALKQQVTTKDKEAADAQQKLKDSQAEAEKKLKDVQSVSTLLGARPGPTPTPRPAPTPLPAGVAPPPPRQPPASYREAVPFTFFIETLTTSNLYTYGMQGVIPGGQGVCNETSIFKRGLRIVWRFEVFDTATGKRIISDDEATIKVAIPNATDLTARFSQRGGGRVPDAPWMWAAAWDIPPDWPLGTLDYTINVAHKDGRNFTWKQPGLVYPDGTEDSRVRIIN